MRIQVGKWGNSLAIRLPQSIASDAGIKEGAFLEASLKGSEVILRRSQQHPTLQELLDGISPDNLHEELDWGAARGNEIW